MKRKNLLLGLLAIATLLGLGTDGLRAVETGPALPVVPECAHLSIGGGYGLNYGGIGMGFEFNPRLPKKFGAGFYKYVRFGMGLGYLPDGGLAYSFGLHLYPLGRDLFLQVSRCR